MRHEARTRPFDSERWSAGTAATDFAFTGERRHDDLGGIYKMGARFYDPVHRRWLSPDTVVPDPSDPQTLNRYSYVTNDPLRWIDPTGHCGGDPQPQAASQEASDEDGWRFWDTSAAAVGLVDGFANRANPYVRTFFDTTVRNTSEIFEDVVENTSATPS